MEIKSGVGLADTPPSPRTQAKLDADFESLMDAAKYLPFPPGYIQRNNSNNSSPNAKKASPKAKKSESPNTKLMNYWESKTNKNSGGKKTKKYAKHKRSKHKRSKHKRSKHKRSKHKRSKHKRSNYNK